MNIITKYGSDNGHHTKRSRKDLFMKLKKQFSDFYDEIRIQGESEQLREKREILQEDIENKFPDELKKHGIELKKSDIEIFDQGSYKLNTTIKDTIIDRDVAVMIPLDIEKYSDPRDIKGYLRDALKYVEARTVNIKEPCVNVAYYENGEEWMHIDLPLYAIHKGNVYLARGREFGDKYSWELADPKGLNADLLGKINGKAQLRRVIRYIKKWKNEKYKNSILDHEIPPSIGLTYLVCDCFVESTEKDDDLVSLQKTLEAIRNQFTTTIQNGVIVRADISRFLPVQPYTDVFKTMKDSSDNYGVTFYKRLDKAIENLTNAVNVESDHDAGVYVQKVFGTDFNVPPKQVIVSSTSNKKEHSFG